MEFKIGHYFRYKKEIREKIDKELKEKFKNSNELPPIDIVDKILDKGIILGNSGIRYFPSHIELIETCKP